MIKILFVPIELIHSLYGLLGVTKCQLEQIIMHPLLDMKLELSKYYNSLDIVNDIALDEQFLILFQILFPSQYLSYPWTHQN